MKAKKPADVVQEGLFRLRLDQLLDQRHELYRLAKKIDWVQFETRSSYDTRGKVNPEPAGTSTKTS
jgi:hypothetical protein